MTTTETRKKTDTNGTTSAPKARAARGSKSMTLIGAAQATMNLRKRIQASGLDVNKLDAIVAALVAAEAPTLTSVAE